jgi:hypothetical protein
MHLIFVYLVFHFFMSALVFLVSFVKLVSNQIFCFPKSFKFDLFNFLNYLPHFVILYCYFIYFRCYILHTNKTKMSYFVTNFTFKILFSN